MKTYIVGSRRFIVLVGALTGLTALSIDISLPALPLIGTALVASAKDTQLTLSAFLLGYALSQLLIGPLSDTFGRKRVLLASLVLFTIAGIGCTFAGTIASLVAWRVAQGIGASAGTILGRSIVRDTHSGSDAARMLSLVTQVMFIAPMVAPLLGTGLLELGSWRLPFGFLVGVGALCLALVSARLGESLPREARKPLSVITVTRGYLRFFSERTSIVPAVIVCCGFAGQFAYIGSSSFVMTEVFGVAPRLFGFFFAANALMLIIGARLSSHLVQERSAREVLKVGAGCIAVGSIGLIAGTVALPLGVVAYVASVGIYFVGIGVALPNAIAVAMEPWKSAAGLASSSLGAAQMLGGACASAMTATLYDGTARPVAMVMASTGMVVAMLALLLDRERVLEQLG